LSGNHATSDHGASGNRRKLAWILALTCVVMLLELVGGLWSGSLVLLADAGHMLSDASALGLALFAMWYGARPSPPQRTYGHYRAEILAAVANAVLLALVTFFVAREALERLRDPAPVDALPVLLLGCLGLGVNLIAVRVLRTGARASLNMRGAYLEVLSDLLASAGVIVAAWMQMQFGWERADSVVSLLIAAFIVPRIWVLMREATDVLMESAPRHLDVVQVRGVILDQHGVRDVHDLHVWTITSGRVCLSAHVVTPREADRDAVIAGINRRLRERFGLDHTTLQVEGRDDAPSPAVSADPACEPCPPTAPVTSSDLGPARKGMGAKGMES